MAKEIETKRSERHDNIGLTQILDFKPPRKRFEITLLEKNKKMCLACINSDITLHYYLDKREVCELIEVLQKQHGKMKDV